MRNHVKHVARVATLILFISSTTHPKGFSDLGLSVPVELTSLNAYFKNPKPTYKLNFPKGTIIVGQSGMGKTRFAKAFSEELDNSQFTYVNVTDLEDAKAVKAVYEEARKKAKQSPNGMTILFLDEFDAFALDNFDDNSGKSEIREKVVTLMNEMDGYKEDLSVIVIAASQTDKFHKSVLRPGRFSQIVELPLPDEKTRVSMIKSLNQGRPFDRTVDVNVVAKLAYNFTPGDLKTLVNKANILAEVEKTSTITQSQLNQAFLDILTSKCRTDKSLLVRLKVAINTLKNNKQEDKGFKRVIGTIPHDVKELVETLKNSGRSNPFNLKVPKGFLFTGPPGTGKTTLARAVAEEAQCEFMSVSGAEFVQSFVGAGGDRIRTLFKEAREKAANSQSGKTILFIDEIDAIGKRNGNTLDSTITTLLTEMDGFEEDDSVIVIAATNNPKNLDPALLRPRRFDKVIKIGLPDLATRELLLKHYSKKKPYNTQTINLQKIAEATNNYSPADLQELLEKAGTLAAKDKARQIELNHMIEAIRQGLNEKLLKGEASAQQQMDALDVIFNGKASTKGFNQIVGGVPPHIQQLADMMSGTLDYKKFGVPYPKGILFTGPPGTGKTMLAKAIAEELGCEFIETKASNFASKWVGEGAENVRTLFAEAREKANGRKTIIFIDELDAIGSRSGNHMTQSEEGIITELLTQMDGFLKDESVIVIGATNSPNSIDSALLRAGRFDTIIEIGLPNLAKRKALLEFYSKNRPVTGVSFDRLAQQLDGCNAADIKELVNKAASIAMRSRADSITQAAFDQALREIKADNETRANTYLNR